VGAHAGRAVLPRGSRHRPHRDASNRVGVLRGESTLPIGVTSKRGWFTMRSLLVHEFHHSALLRVVVISEMRRADDAEMDTSAQPRLPAAALGRLTGAGLRVRASTSALPRFTFPLDRHVSPQTCRSSIPLRYYRCGITSRPPLRFHFREPPSGKGSARRTPSADPRALLEPPGSGARGASMK
jgi:hypothetical protein